MCRSHSQAYQQLAADEDAAAELFGAMHVCDDEDMKDPLEDSTWDKIMLIKVQPIDFESFSHHKSDIESMWNISCVITKLCSP